MEISNALARRLKEMGACHDKALAHAFETGEALTRPARSPLQSVIGRIASTFIQAGPKATPRRHDADASRRRKRTWSGSSGLPDSMRGDYTEAERAALCVIAHEVKRHGVCSLPIDRIAAVAGVSRTTVQNAIRKARSVERSHLSVELRPQAGRKNLPNVIRIVSSAWMRWLKRSIGFKGVSPSEREEEIISLNTRNDGFEGAFERERAERSDPNNHWLRRPEGRQKDRWQLAPSGRPPNTTSSGKS